jgi:glycerol-1-phosphate dehydrogenase [NAD(P)+]
MTGSTIIPGGLLHWDALRARLSGTAGLRPVGLRHVVVGPNALDELPDIVAALRDGRTGDAVVVRDEVPKRLGDEDLHVVVARLLGISGAVRELTLTGPGGHVYADESTVDTVVAGAAGAAVLVTVGSGTLADLGKMAAAGTGAPHVVVQTATSVNGFADDQSVLIRSGVKRTVPSRWPEALVVDTGVLAAAPAALNRAGFGDLLSMFTAPADWLLADVSGFAAGYHPVPVNLVRPHGDQLLALAPGLAAAEPEALAVLAELLTLSGLSMGVAGATAPSSGMEHLISHLLEMRANAHGHPAASHGEQVGVGCLVAATTWARVRTVLGSGIWQVRLPEPDVARRRIEDAFLGLDPSGRTARECLAAYAAKLRTLESVWPRVRRLLADWDRADERFGRLLVEPARLAEALRTLGAPTRFEELRPEYTPDVARWAITNAHLMRDRFTVADLADLLGLGDAGLLP